MRREQFLASAAATFSMLWAQPAFATGGLDVDDDLHDEDARRTDAPVAPAIAGGLAVRIRVAGDDPSMYRGTLASAGSLRINTLPIEEYLMGVVPLEMPSAWPQAALEAQTIVARTYALRKRNPAKTYDLVAGTADQMYGGIHAESPAATNAVASTSGSIVVYNGIIADVAYMSCCGGHTEDSQHIWGADVPYLHGVADPYCSAAPDSTWTVTLEWAQLSRACRLEAAPLEHVQLIGNPGARATALRFIGDGTSQDLDILDMRRAFAHALPSTFIRNVAVESNGDDAKILITGAGRGHGVGLCQWGARGLAAAGASAAQIIAFYFPNTRLGRASSIT